MTHHTALRFCAGCRRPLPPEMPIGAVYCDAPVCQTRAKVAGASNLAKDLGDHKADLRERTFVRVRRAVEEAKARMIAEDPTVEGATIAVELAPNIEPGYAPATQDRRDAFLAHLDDILDMAYTYGPPAPVPLKGWEIPSDLNPETRERQINDEPMTLTAACIACQGNCCMQAQHKNAFVTVHTLRSVLAENPDLPRDELREMYVSRLPKEQVKRSCLFHGPIGCTLPREIRSGVCNRWECGHRHRLRTQLEETGATHVVVAGMAEDHPASPEAGADVLRVVTANESDFEIHTDLRPDALPPKLPKSLYPG